MKVMKKCFFAVLSVLVIGACENSLKPDDLYVPPPEEKTDRGELVLDQGLVVYTMPGDADDVDGIPNNNTIGRYPETYTDKELAGKYIINGPVIGTSKLDSGGFTDVMFLYHNEPIAGDFRMKARIRITANAGSSTSKGYMFGFFTGENAEDAEGHSYVKFSQTSRGGGMLFRTNDTGDVWGAPNNGPAIRPYIYDNKPSWGTSSSLSENVGTGWLNTRVSSWKSELILELKRRDDGLHLTVYNSKTGLLYEPPDPRSNASAIIPNDKLYSSIVYGQQVYPGIALLGTSVEFSEFNLWVGPDGNEVQKLTMPATKPAYVPVEGVKIGVSLNGAPVNVPPQQDIQPQTGAYNVYSVAWADRSKLQLVPVFEPEWADNSSVEWKVVRWNPVDAVLHSTNTPDAMLEPIPGSNRITVNPPGPGTALIMVTSKDPQLETNSVLETLADYTMELTFN